MYFEIQHIFFITLCFCHFLCAGKPVANFGWALQVHCRLLVLCLLWSSSSLLHYRHCHHCHHQATGMINHHRNNQKLNGIGFIIIIRLLECSVSTEGNNNWMELNLPSASHHHQTVRMLNQHRNKQDHHCLCVYMSHVRIQLIINYWNHTERCSIFAEISPKITAAPLK
jgi:hypothetical protein